MKEYSIFIDKKTGIVKMFVFPHLFCRFSKIPVKTIASYFVGIDKLILKFI